MDKFVIRKPLSSSSSSTEASSVAPIDVPVAGSAARRPLDTVSAPQREQLKKGRSNKRPPPSGQSNGPSLSRLRLSGTHTNGSSAPAPREKGLRSSSSDGPGGILAPRNRAPNEAGIEVPTSGEKSNSLGMQSRGEVKRESGSSIDKNRTKSSSNSSSAFAAGKPALQFREALGAHKTEASAVDTARHGHTRKSAQSRRFMSNIKRDSATSRTNEPTPARELVDLTHSLATAGGPRRLCSTLSGRDAAKKQSLEWRARGGREEPKVEKIDRGGAAAESRSSRPEGRATGSISNTKNSSNERENKNSNISIDVDTRKRSLAMSSSTAGNVAVSKRGSSRHEITGATAPCEPAHPTLSSSSSVSPTTLAQIPSATKPTSSKGVEPSSDPTGPPPADEAAQGRDPQPFLRADRITSFFPRANFESLAPRRGSERPSHGENIYGEGESVRDFSPGEDRSSADDSDDDDDDDQEDGDKIDPANQTRVRRQLVQDSRTGHHSTGAEERGYGEGNPPRRPRPTETPRVTIAADGGGQRPRIEGATHPNREDRALTSRSVSSLAAQAAERRARMTAMIIDEDVRVLSEALSPMLATDDSPGEVAKAVDGAGEAEIRATVAVHSEAVSATATAAEVAEASARSQARANAFAARVERAQQPARRRGGMGALFLAQRQSTGCRPAGGGGFGVDAGRQAFRRRVLSKVFEAGMTTMELKMGKVVGSHTGAGVVCGHPERVGRLARSPGVTASTATAGSAAVSCLEFDSMGALLAVGGADNVSVYDFDEYLPQVSRVRPAAAGEACAHLQPTHCIYTRQFVSCVRWNPANENQLAVSFLHYDEIRVFDLELILPNAEAVPVLTLVPDGVRGRHGSNGGGAFRERSRSVGAFASGRRNADGPPSIRGLGHMSFEFVEVPRCGHSGRSRETRVVAGGRGGVFRVWRVSPTSAGELSPYLQVVPSGSNPCGQSFAGWLSPRADITALCCITPDVVVVGTDSGTLATFSLLPAAVKAFGSGKSAERLGQWFLGDESVWGGCVFAGAKSSSGALRIRTVKPSRAHAVGVVVCGLPSRGVIVFDTRTGRALGVTAPGKGSLGAPLFCQVGAGGAWGEGVLAWSPEQQTPGAGHLTYLTTSACAGLDASRKGGRDASLRPGPGWALGEAGGGGFRVAASKRYDLCLPMEVKRATPGQSAVELSADARSFLCPRAEVRLLRSRLVTSSILIGGEEHSVEAMGSDGMTLILDRRYRGPLVREDDPKEEEEEDEEGVVSGHAERGQAAQNGVGALSGSTLTGPPAGRGGSTDEYNDGEAPIDPERQRGVQRGQPLQQGRRSTGSGGRSTAEGGPPRGVVETTPTPTTENSSSSVFPAAAAATAATTPRAPSSDSYWDRSWCPTNGVRVFAKLKAIFGDADIPTTASRRGGRPKSSDLMALDVSVGGDYVDSEASDDQSDSKSEIAEGEVAAAPVPPTESWASLQVVAKASLLELSATAMTAHPDMNFVLFGLLDGTVAVVLPGKRTKLGKRKRRCKRRRRQEKRGLFPSLWDNSVELDGELE